jgi:hypothetical protein
MDLYATKNKIAEAFVESIFRRAQHPVRPFRSEHVTLRIGHEDFSPNFAIRGDETDGPGLLVEVKYRPFIDQFMALENQRRYSSIFVLARRHWPTLHFVLVTDHPEPGRSCFQAIALTDGDSSLLKTVDLIDLADLVIFRQNVEDHERLLLRTFDLLAHA